MTTSIKGLNSASASNRYTLGRLAMRTLVLMLSLIIFVTIHELIHLVVGRAVGLPTYFFNLTSVGVSREVMVSAPSASLALMNGIAPLVTFVMGILVLSVLVAIGSRLPDLLNRFLAWWAIFGIPYIGLQMMASGGPVTVRGDGEDFAAVLVGYFGLPHLAIALISVVGGVLFLLVGFWLRRVLAIVEGIPAAAPFRWKDLRIVPTIWRRYIALALVVLLLVDILIGALQVAQGNYNAVSFFGFFAPLLWLIIVALLIPWRTPVATLIRNRWIIPGLVAGILFLILGILLPIAGDYGDIILYVLTPLLTTTWALTGTVAARE
ncbi:MAG TPA: hypothetical protein VFB12_24980 [Ktedonobacteraceae bacterium]|nr:hypothetical protein [Ktedonobacteraceae bacterium]